MEAREGGEILEAIRSDEEGERVWPTQAPRARASRLEHSIDQASAASRERVNSPPPEEGAGEVASEGLLL